MNTDARRLGVLGKQLRESLGVSVEWLAAASGLSVIEVQRMESGRQMPPEPMFLSWIAPLLLLAGKDAELRNSVNELMKKLPLTT